MTGASSERGVPRGRLAVIVSIAIIAIWAALLAGIAQGAITAFNEHVRHQIVYASRDVYWMAPLSYLLLFAVLGAVLTLVALIVPRAISVRVATILCLWLTLFSLTLPYGMIARWAAVALSLGAAVAVGRWLTADAVRWQARATRQLLGMAVLIALVAVGTRGGRALSTQRAVAALPAPSADAPNVLLIILDTMRSANMHLYGWEQANTPVLERIAAQSAVFDNAIAPAPWTLPSHATMFTGLNPDELSSNYISPLDGSVPTVAERLASHGFDTVGFVANHHYTGFDTGLARGFARYEDYKVTIKQTMRTSWPMQALYFFDPVAFGGNATIVKTDEDKVLQVPPKSWAHAKRAQEVVDEFLKWQTDRPDRPYFAFLNMYDAHDPRFAPRDVRRNFHYKLPNMELYDAAMAYMDREIGRMLDTLAARAALDNTVVIVASDHGELFGEHQLWGHANSLYLDVLRVPLIIRYPARIPPGSRVTRSISLRDLAATITDLAGLPHDAWLPGNTLVPLMNCQPNAASSPAVSFAHQTINLSRKFPTARGDMYSVIDDSLHFIRNAGDSGEELFAWKLDRKEEHDLTKTPEAQPQLQRLRALAHRATGPKGGQDK
ncbi:MAG: sulfatase-like hydrolase/transferase [Gemmatimonadaceae bacterium]